MNTDKIKMPLAVIMTINGARGLLWNLVANYHFSGDDIDIIMRCIKDLENLNLILQKQDNVSNNIAKTDLQHLQAENNRLKKTLEQIINDTEYGEFIDLDSAKKALNGESEEQ